MKRRLKFKKRYVFCLLFIALGLGIKDEGSKLRGYGVIESVLAEMMAGQVVDFIMPVSGICKTGRDGGVIAGEGEFVLKEFPIMVQAMPISRAETGEEEDIFAAMLAENGNGGTGVGIKDGDDGLSEIGTAEMETEEVLSAGGMEGDFEDVTGDVLRGEFQRAEKTNFFDFDSLSDYQTLVSTFYTIDAGTTAGSSELNLEDFLSKDMTISKESPGPQILIYHTHSLEAFADSVPGERSQTIVGVGERLAEILTEEYGYSVLHHAEEYDTKRDDAYANSLPGIKKVLEENPSIQVVIDLHRDAGVKDVRRAITLNGKPTATFMLFNGLSRTRKTGDIDYLYNPYRADNLAFSFQMQVKAGEYYPGLTRKIYLKAYRYNMHLVPKTLLIELGDSNNTVEEVMNTCDPLAHILDMVLSGEG